VIGQQGKVLPEKEMEFEDIRPSNMMKKVGLFE